MPKRRDKFQIIQDILILLQNKGKVKPTHILYGGNLSHKRLKKYIRELEEKKLISMVNEGDRVYYQITEKGLNMISESRKVKEMMDAFGL